MAVCLSVPVARIHGRGRRGVLFHLVGHGAFKRGGGHRSNVVKFKITARADIDTTGSVGGDVAAIRVVPDAGAVAVVFDPPPSGDGDGLGVVVCVGIVGGPCFLTCVETGGTPGFAVVCRGGDLILGRGQTIGGLVKKDGCGLNAEKEVCGGNTGTNGGAHLKSEGEGKINYDGM